MGKSAQRITIGAVTIGAAIYVAWATWIVSAVAALRPKPAPIVTSRISPECDELAHRVESKLYGMREHAKSRRGNTIGELSMLLGPPGWGRSSPIPNEPGSRLYTWALARHSDGAIGVRASNDGRWVADLAKARVDSSGKVLELDLDLPTVMDREWCARALE